MAESAIPSNANPDFIMATLPRDAFGGVRRTGTTDAVVHLGDLAMVFGRIDRTACYHPGGRRKETDTDHTVMLSWVACAIADKFYRELDLGLVAQFALVHDAPEVYAGDTQTLRISPEGKAAKREREAAAVARLAREFAATLPWFPILIATYERQVLPEARFVRALDKSLPKVVHLLDNLHGLAEFGITRDELTKTLADQTADIATYAREFPELAEIRAELIRRLLSHPRWQANGYLAPEGEV
jgi:putative hydrolases of HD superfamily